MDNGGKAHRLAVEDDGPGFEPEILERIGEPYVTSRPGQLRARETELGPSDAFSGQHGMGLGFFIAKTLIEQTGGSVKAQNRVAGRRESHAALASRRDRRRGAGRAASSTF